MYAARPCKSAFEKLRGVLWMDGAERWLVKRKSICCHHVVIRNKTSISQRGSGCVEEYLLEGRLDCYLDGEWAVL